MEQCAPVTYIGSAIIERLRRFCFVTRKEEPLSEDLRDIRDGQCSLCM